MRKRVSGFTLIELLVAVAIAAVLVGLVFYIFGQMQRGTRSSLLRAQISLTAMTMDARLRDDAAGMLGPNRAPQAADPPAGCLVIVPALREGRVPLPDGSMSRNKVRLRSDQLVFFSRRDPTAPHPWVSLVPKDGGLPQDITSYEARVWYGALRDGNLDAASDEAAMAHRWMVGRDLKLVRTTASGTETLDLTVQSALDYTPVGATSGTNGGLRNVLAAATSWDASANLYTRAGSWTDADYLAQLIGTDAAGQSIPNDKTRYTNQPVTTPVVDLKQLQGNGSPPVNPNGVQLDDLAQSHMRLLENCSEIIVQFAADLDKDGRLDTYPQGHPLAGALIWYPEELHFDPRKGGTSPSADIQAKLTAIQGNDWTKAFPSTAAPVTGFAPALGIWPAGRFGATPASGKWQDRFQLDYGETTNPSGGQAASAPSIPAAYVFRFEDDQYRLVNYGFRQDGSIYANQFDGMAGIAPFPATATSQRHWTPFPPMPAGIADANNPTTVELYGQSAATVVAPPGPYPLNAPTGATGAAGSNFGDALGNALLPAQSAPPYAFPVPAAGAYRATPDATYANGQKLSVTQVGRVTSLGVNSAAAAEPLYDPAVDTPYTKVPGDFGATNNHAGVYSDLWRQWFLPVNTPSKQGTVEDWRNPQSDWPKLVRIRLRLNDPQGLVFSYSDEILINGRDDDGDGVVDNPEEGRMSGVWYEYVIAVPYPLDPAPHGHAN